MNSYRIGRGKKGGITPDIMIPDADTSVSRIHAKLTEQQNGTYLLEDLSDNGTYRHHNGHWVKISRSEVGYDEPIALGKYRTTVKDLLALPRRTPVVERNPDTGEIISR